MTDAPIAAETLPHVDEPQATLAPVDVDEIELQEAQAAAKADQAGAAGDPPADPVIAATETKPSGEKPPAQPAEQPMIPKARLDEVLGDQRKIAAERDKLAQEAAYWRGQAEARKEQSPQTGTAAQPAPDKPKTPEEQRSEIRNARLALAKKFDDGELTMADFEAERDKLAEQQDALREKAFLDKVKPAPQPQGGSDVLYLETLTAQLEEAHPWVGVAEQVGTDADWRWVREQAIERCVARGVDVQAKNGPLEKYELRKEVAQVWSEKGPLVLADRAKDKGVAIPGAAKTDEKPPASGVQPQRPATLSQQAQQRLDKIAQAQGAPPDLGKMGGHVGDGPADVSDARIEAMNEEEIGNLPPSVRKKLLGIAA